jgi:enediyne biosynthesis protein E4
MTIRVPAVLATALAAGAVALSAQVTSPVRLTDITRQAGIDVVHRNGATGKKYLPETMGSGSAFIDYDGDGDQDLLFVNGVFGPEGCARLFRNDGRGTFTDATKGAGLDVGSFERGAIPASSVRLKRPPVQKAQYEYGMGVAAADFDNDGFTDVLITAVGQNRLFRNTGKGGFVDVTTRAGLTGRHAFSTSAMWLDYDRDGLVDLLICNYVQWTTQTDIFCSADGKQKSYCTPEAYRGSTSWLFRNRGNGTFEDVTASAGLFDVTSKSLGVTMLDYDQDRWPDVFVANDTQPNKLYRNNQNGTFTELGLKSGLAFSDEGRARAGMGVDAADVDNTGRPVVAVTNFSGEMLGLYAPLGDGQYVDRAPGSDVGRATRQTLGWGCFFFDADLDGRQDLLVVNGHLDAALARAERQVHYAETPHLFLNRGGRFTDVAREAGAGFVEPKVGRGAAFGDIDRDGDLDIVVTSNNGRAYVYRNELARPDRGIRLRLRGTKSNRDAIGARVTVSVGAVTASRLVRTGSSYLSQSELPVTFGLGDAARADRVVIEWPSGRKDDLGALKAGFQGDVVEGSGLKPQRPAAHGQRPTAGV